MTKTMLNKVLNNPTGYSRGKKYVYSMQANSNKIFKIDKDLFDNQYYDAWELVGYVRQTACGFVLVKEDI